MALPENGLITMQMLATEYSIAIPCTFTQLYGKPGIPSSGKITFADFYGKANTFTLNITTSVASPDIHQLALTAGWSGTSPLIVNFNCPYVNSLRLDGSKTFPAGLTLNIASGCWIGGVINSGAAMYIRVPVTVNNAGTIAGGGGKGGGGGVGFAYYGSTTVTAYGGSGGNGQGFANTSSLTISPPASGAAGEYKSATVVGGTCWAKGGTGAVGGPWGQQGGVGGYSSYGGVTTGGSASTGDTGNSAGNYVNGISYVTWSATGTRLGTFS